MPSWIKLRDDLDTDPRVFAMAAALRQTAALYVLSDAAKDLFGSVTEAVTRNVMRDVTVAGLSRVWFAANRHTTDGVFRNATLDYLDTLAQVPGFGKAMESVGYAAFDPVTLTVTLPRFSEYNAPDKNGERSKTAAARRQQRLRDRKSALEKLAAETPINSVNPVTTPDDEASRVTRDVTLSVTPPVTSRHNENNVTPSLSCSLSNSESKNSDSDSEPTVNQVTQAPPHDPDPLGTLKLRINALRPSWLKSPHWSAEEDSALYEARHNLAALDDTDWHLLAWFFKWANSAANTGQKDPVKVSARRAHLCHDLAALLDRATTAWKQAGAPRLGDAVTSRVTSRVTPPAPELPPAENAAAFAGLLAANGIRRHPTVATNPATA